MSTLVEITFDCLPLRSLGRLDAPLDASPEVRELSERIKQAIAEHGAHNAYYLHRANCRFHLTNDPDCGMLEFEFDGTVLTDANDRKTVSCDLKVQLVRETCDWLTEPVVDWFEETVRRAVLAEFNRYIASGDLEQTNFRAERVAAASDNSGGYLGMHL